MAKYYIRRSKNQPQTSSTIKALILIALLAGGGYFIYTAFLASNTISHSFVSWEQSGSQVDTAKINQPVTLKLNIFSNVPLGYTGKVKVEIKKDVVLGTDIIVKTSTIDINLPIFNNTPQQVAVTFTPNEVTNNVLGTSIGVREYYYKIYIGDKAIYDPTTPGERNGLLVSSKAAGGTVPQVTGILFNDKPQIEVSSGTAITTKVIMSGTGKGTLKAEVRQDNIGLPDNSYTTLTKDITLTGTEDTVVTLPTWKAVAGGLTFREYFARVYWNGDLIYDPCGGSTDLNCPNQREYVRISGGSTGGGGNSAGQATLKSVTWNVNPNQYSTAIATFIITGTYNNPVTIDIRKNIQFGNGCILDCRDENLVSVSKQISGTDQEVTVTIPFTAPGAGSWVFLRAQGIYDSIDPATRRAQGVEVQVPSAGTGTTPSATPSPGTTTTPAPAQASVSYNIIGLKSAYGSGTRIDIPVGSEVQVYATVTSSAATSGTLSVEVRKDLTSLNPYTPDATMTVLSKPGTSLQAGVNTIYAGSFIASDATGSNNFRQYFFKPSWNGILLNDPKDPSVRESVATFISSSAPPSVTPLPTPQGTVTPPVQQGSLQILKVGFGNPPQDVYTANKGEYVPVYAYVAATGGNAQGAVKIEIRKDYIAIPDATVATLQNAVSLNAGETKYVMVGSFVPDESDGLFLREYFGRASLNGVLVFDPRDPASRPRVLVN